MFVLDAFEPRHKLNTKKAAKRECHLALAMGVDKVSLDTHLGVVTDETFDHGRYL